MNTANSNKTIWVDTSMHRATLCEFEADVSYSEETLTQDARNKVHSFSMLAGEPVTKFELSHIQRSLAAAVGAMAVCAFILAVWPQ